MVYPWNDLHLTPSMDDWRCSVHNLVLQISHCLYILYSNSRLFNHSVFFFALWELWNWMHLICPLCPPLLLLFLTFYSKQTVNKFNYITAFISEFLSQLISKNLPIGSLMPQNKINLFKGPTTTESKETSEAQGHFQRPALSQLNLNNNVVIQP